MHVDTVYNANGPKVTWNKDLMPLPLRPFPGIKQLNNNFRTQRSRNQSGYEYQSQRTRNGKKRGTEGTGSEPLPLTVYGIGFNLVTKLGWNSETVQGLGKYNHGIRTPVNIQYKTDRLGIITPGEVTADGTRAPQDPLKKKKAPGARASERRRLARRKREREMGLPKGALAPEDTPPKEGGPMGAGKQKKAVRRRIRKEERLGLPPGALKNAGMLAPKHLKRLLRGDAGALEGNRDRGEPRQRRAHSDSNFIELGSRSHSMSGY